MQSERWLQIEKLYHAARERSLSDRHRFLEEQCVGDAELLREVESLLADEESAGSFLETPAFQAAAKALGNPSHSMIGQTLGRYEVQSLLGVGGMGEVYRGRDLRLDRAVAIKILAAPLAHDPDFLRRFEREARAVAALSHPNILAIHDFGDQQGISYAVTELLEGETLRSRLTRGALHWRQAVEIAAAIADGLVAAHSKGITHRDLKPENIFLTRDRRVKILDFGLAKIEPALTLGVGEAPTVSHVTELGGVMGTVAYMSPEQAEGRKVDARSDVFSFGSVLYEMVTGRRAFEGESRIATLMAVLRHEPKPIVEIVQEIPAAVEELIARCLKKDLNQRIQHMAQVKEILDEALENPAPAHVPHLRQLFRRHRCRGSLGLVIVATLVTIGLAVRRLTREVPVEPPSLSRITFDTGLTTDPALSIDGKLLAYASDRSGDGNLDIWVQQVSGGNPVRLTSHPTDDSQPHFSPDGTKIVFRSEREGGGLYVIPALGGDEHLLAPLGRNPRFSPDNRWIAYWIGRPDFPPVAPGAGRVFIIPASGGAPRQLRSEFSAARYPIWAPDSKHILFLGTSASYTDENAQQVLDWWVTPLENSAPVKTGFVNQAPYRMWLPRPGEWILNGSRVIFAAQLESNINLWEVLIPGKTGRVGSAPRQLTFGTGLETNPAFAAGTLVFSGLSANLDVWSLPGDANKGEFSGAMNRLTQSPADEKLLSISTDGRILVFGVGGIDRYEFHVKELTGGPERTLIQAGEDARAVVTDDGSMIAYTLLQNNNKRPAFVLATSGGIPDQVCDDCNVVTGWSHNAQRILYWWGQPRRIGLLNLGSRQRTDVLADPKLNLYGATFSPDDHWISFFGRTGPDRSALYVTPFRNNVSIAPEEWIAVTDGTTRDRDPRWSPDGSLLYFISERDGSNCIWAQRLATGSRTPLGAAFPIHHFHNPRQTQKITDTQLTGSFSIAKDKIVFDMAEASGNIWRLQLPEH